MSTEEIKSSFITGIISNLDLNSINLCVSTKNGFIFGVKDTGEMEWGYNVESRVINPEEWYSETAYWRVIIWNLWKNKELLSCKNELFDIGQEIVALNNHENLSIPKVEEIGGAKTGYYCPLCKTVFGKMQRGIPKENQV